MAARDWLDEHLAGPPRTIGLPWPSLLAFLRLTTNPRIYSPPAPVGDAWDRVKDWLRRPAAWVPAPGGRHAQHLEHLVASVQPSGNLVPDTHLAALCLEHGLIVVSTDTDFAKFPVVTWLDPTRPQTA
jgi:toxin-antitoxin system PIN domain toxin